MHQRGSALIVIPILVAVIVAAVIFAVMQNLIKVPFLQNPLKQANTSPSVELKNDYKNPFDKSTQYSNPFSSYKNPFDSLK